MQIGLKQGISERPCRRRTLSKAVRGRDRLPTIVLSVLLICLSSCAEPIDGPPLTPAQRMLLEADQRLNQAVLEGAAVGAIGGALLGYLAGSTKGALIGAATGAVGGGLTGYAIAIDRYRHDQSEANLRSAIAAANADADLYETSAEASETIADELRRERAEMRSRYAVNAISSNEYKAVFYSFSGSSRIIRRHIASMAARIAGLRSDFDFSNEYRFQLIANRIGAAHRRELSALERIDMVLSECGTSTPSAEGSDRLPASRDVDHINAAQARAAAVSAQPNRAPANTTPTVEPQQLSPLFPWPPPTASAWYVLPNDLIVGPPSSAPTLYTASERLRAVLAAAGYTQTGFYSVPGGFAIVTDMERINDDATPIYSDRWRPIDGSRDWSLSTYIRGLIYADPGRFRIIAFIVTDHPFLLSGGSITPAIATRWASHGVNVLPPSLGDIRFDTRVYRCTSLVYEFRARREMKPDFVRRSSEPARVHLERAQIWSAFQTLDSDR